MQVEQQENICICRTQLQQLLRFCNKQESFFNF